MIKHTFVLFATLWLFSSQVFAQKIDEFSFYTGAGIGVLHMNLRGVDDVAESGYSSVGGTLVPIAPRYEMVETTAIVLPMLVVAGFNIPVINKENWSLGLKAQAGFGPQANAKNAAGLESMALDFPQFMYYRSMFGKLDCSFLAGYTFKRSGLKYSLPLVGLEFGVSEYSRIRFTASPATYKYYMYYTDGREEPALSIREFSFTWCRNF